MPSYGGPKMQFYAWLCNQRWTLIENVSSFARFLCHSWATCSFIPFQFSAKCGRLSRHLSAFERAIQIYSFIHSFVRSSAVNRQYRPVCMRVTSDNAVLNYCLLLEHPVYQWWANHKSNHDVNQMTTIPDSIVYARSVISVHLAWLSMSSEFCITTPYRRAPPSGTD